MDLSIVCHGGGACGALPLSAEILANAGFWEVGVSLSLVTYTPGGPPGSVGKFHTQGHLDHP